MKKDVDAELEKIDILEFMDEKTEKTLKPENGTSQTDKNSKKKKKKSKLNKKQKFYVKIGIIAAEIILGLLVLILGLGTYKDAKNLKAEAYAMKASLKTVAQCAKDKNTTGAKNAVVDTKNHENEIKNILSKPLWKIYAVMPISSNYVKPVWELLDIMDEGMEQLVDPGLELLQKYPMDSMKVGDGFNVEVINTYVNFLEEKEDVIIDLVNKVNAVQLPAKLGFDLSKYTSKISEMTAVLDNFEDYIDLMKAFLGDGEDKLYLLAAQNSAEMRASGGFPGSIGTIKIENGVLTIGDFQSVYKVLNYSTNYEVKQTDVELELFQGWLYYPRDAVYCPDFERVAEIWSYGYKDKIGEDIDGVVSLSPIIIQKLLAVTGGVTLSDGTTLDGTNATYMLQYGFYYKYLDKYTDEGNGMDYTDKLFAETAKQVMSKLVADIGVDKFANYLSIFEEGKDDRIIMMWMNSDSEQELIRKIGCNGGLNHDKNNPKLGVYFSLSDPCKLGWFLDINTDIGVAKVNKDGTRSYDVTVTLNNIITKDEMDSSVYILGNNGGAAQGFIHIFAPEGGTVSDFEVSKGFTMKMGEYEGLEVGYSHNVLLYSEQPITITFKVTTAKGVTEPLGISSTPTLQQYR